MWEDRDQNRHLLTEESYQQMGGVAGALASHADEVLDGLPTDQQALASALFQRLVTSEETRAIVDVSELQELGDPAAVDRLIRSLVHARLLVVQTRGGGGPAAEIVHESLITQWPRLRSWLEENHEDAALLEQLRTAAKQWEQKGRPAGLLWHGEAEQEALRFRKRYQGHLAAREESFLDEVVALGIRANRRKRFRVIGAIAFLSTLVVAGGVALILQTRALTAEQKMRWTLERAQSAEDQRERAVAEKARAESEGLAAKKQLTEAERRVLASQKEAQKASRAAEAQLTAAEQLKAEADRQAWTTEELAAALRKAELEKAKTQRQLAEAHRKAELESRKAQAANESLQKLLSRERKQNQRLKLEAAKIKTGRLE
jgi:hypothetical protein